MTKTLTSLSLLSFMAGALASAQPTPGVPPDPAAMAAHQVSRLTNLLTLSADQQTKATAIFTASATADQALHATITTLRANLKTAIEGNSGVSAAVSALEVPQTQMLLNDSNAQAQFYQILAADQKTKYDMVLSHGVGFGGPRGPDGPGGPGGQGFRHRQQ